ncbi:CesT family type III secretion system chaperone [Erwiniaceae bacterium BAC15a-03b]|uniref:CesT family type III secretion system chaperone n=1 Tax=Winslowiella arboricola TaxID=2978220 RepID=A0A9J6PJU7_9GAMM|nr:CesT family type III secretion system chaperone [Winslowiella arboricola]MCU5774053.1 CesT family type III secretion system chaperone [Winslowiella arboricola]MCU5777014.1 CesT family type III secretion system chaperone [Winslowiella arboricola]
MAASNALKNLLMPLLQAPGEAAPALEDSDSYTLSLSQDLLLELSETPQEFLTVSCLLDIPQERYDEWETLAILLQSNLLGMEHPPIITGLLIEQKKVILWTRQPFVVMDTQSMKVLVERFARQAEHVQAWLLESVETESVEE